MTAPVHFSRNVSKLGGDIPSVSLPPILTCPAGIGCAKKCYARKGRFAFSKNKELLMNNLNVWRTDPQAFEQAVMNYSFFSAFFRWHVAGDIPDASYLRMMVRVTEACRSTKFLAFTKQYELVNNHIRMNGKLPDNLTIVLSAWGDIIPQNPFNLPVAYIRFKSGNPVEIPSDARHCMKYCGECVMSGCSCWSLKEGQSVVFDEH